MLPRCKQREGESLRNYLDRFNEETHGMSDLDSIMVVGAVLDGLRECPFLDSLTRDVPRDLSEVMSRAQKYIASDEFKAGRKEHALQRAEEFRREESRRSERAPQRDMEQTRYRPPRADDRGVRDQSALVIRPVYDNYTSLNTSREHIMIRIQDKKILKPEGAWPRRPPKKRSCKFCTYHKDDSFVVVLDIGIYRMHRVLVDTGSSADIIFWDVFDRMKIGAENLKPCKTPLAGFTGDPIYPEGIITLPVTLGTPPSNRLCTQSTFSWCAIPQVTMQLWEDLLEQARKLYLRPII
ncbi:hypothetical protein J5N97_005031 [Dioscorea zingiberensis]|uniref:Retrotransposon gag domain-containing protein n=1 Tax=Dioscorea zingiberensis TaxID=325984 RepID=A0A9D5D7B4_9LILI|nr:hypothetical protein J5N97_005031 [Dioscorea zingiberensis]